MKIFRRTIVTAVIAASVFTLGALFQKFKFFPYPQVKSVAIVVLSGVKGMYADPKELLSRQLSYDDEKIALDRNVDTSLLPLRLKGVRISDHFPAPKVGGGITTIGEFVIVLDRLGNLYSYRPDDTAPVKLPFPGIPNNIESYIAQAGSHVDTKTFRAYSVTFMETARLLAVSHEYFDKQARATRMAVSVIGIDAGALKPVGAWQTVFLGDVEPEGSNDASGGRMISNGSDKIVLTVGDYLLPDPVAQDPNSTFGKLIEIDLANKTNRKLTLGHRNPQGLARAKSGALLSTEHGPAGGDELNVISEGSNYGWPLVTLGTEYETYGWNDESLVGRHTGYVAPYFAWVPSIGVSNLIQIKAFHPRWNGDLLVGSLKAETLYRLRWDGTRVVYSEPIWIGQRIRDIAELNNGAIALWTDDAQLQILKVDDKRLIADMRPGVAASDVLYTQCMYCHHFGPTKVSDSAPSLSGLFDRKIGSDNFRYSAGLRNKEGSWTEQKLREFLTKPDKFANGTSMPQPPLSQPDLNEIIETLKHQKAGLKAGQLGADPKQSAAASPEPPPSSQAQPR